jgi:hypothetical protein
MNTGNEIKIHDLEIRAPTQNPSLQKVDIREYKLMTAF